MNLSGKPIADSIFEEIKSRMAVLKRKPCLAVVLVGSHGPSLTYVNAKKKACETVGMLSRVYHYEESISQTDLLNKISELNHESEVDGILIQSPLPSPLSFSKVIEAVDPAKDVDGFHPLNMGKLLLGQEGGFVSCTPLGIKILLERYHIDIEGKHVVIVGRSAIVGKPLAALLLQNAPHCNATVTVAHSKTKQLTEITKSADILIAALGIAYFIQPDMVKEGAVVVDVGIHRLADKHIIGDVDFERVSKKCSAITPVPGGVGPMTIAMLLQNTLISSERRQR